MNRVIDIKYTDVLDKSFDNSVEVGVFGDDGAELIEKAVTSEFGSYPLIPSRPFIRYTIDTNNDKIDRFINNRVKDIINGKIDVEGALNRIGHYVRKLIVQSINRSREWAVPNSAITIKLKGTDQPLVHTGELRLKISFRLNV